MPSAIQLEDRFLTARQPARVIRLRRSQGDYALAIVCVSILALISMAWSRAVAHWFLLPIMACGVLAGVDIVRWLRGRLDLFDPRTVIACLAFYGFFAAPLLHVIWDRFGAGYDFVLFGDWRPWLGAMAALNAMGLIVYRGAQNFVYGRTKPTTTHWEFERRRSYPVLAASLALSVAGASVYVWQLGGILNEVEAYESNQAAFVGTGWLLVLAWPLAVLSFIVIVSAWTDHGRNGSRNLIIGMLILSAVGIGHFILMGWHGSRSATIWALFWMAGIVHFRFQKLSPRIVAAAVILLIAFMYFYGFYKDQGRAGFEVLRSPSMWLQPRGYQRDLKGLLLGDLARADSNAFILHNLEKDQGDYDYRWGATYAGAFAILIPKKFWPDRPEYKVDAGTEAQLGKATPWRSARVYGLVGEAMLNFGPLGVPPLFAIYGGLLGAYRRKMRSWGAQDTRMFLAPFITILFAAGLVSDSDNIVFAAITEGTLVFAAIFAASKRSLAVCARTPDENSSHS